MSDFVDACVIFMGVSDGQGGRVHVEKVAKH